MRHILVFESLQRVRPPLLNGPEAGAIYSSWSRFRSRTLFACFLVFALSIGLLVEHGSAAGLDNQLPGAPVEEIRKLADEGSAEAQYKLAKMYEEGLEVPRDAKEAAKWYLKAAENGNPKAQYKMGALYTLGKGVPKDRVEATKWFGRAAQQGYEPVKQQLQETGAKLKDQLLKDPVGFLWRKLGG
jgi:hypothetical protein